MRKDPKRGKGQREWEGLGVEWCKGKQTIGLESET